MIMMSKHHENKHMLSLYLHVHCTIDITKHTVQHNSLSLLRFASLPSTLVLGFEWGIYSCNVCAYVRTCPSRSGTSIALICTHVHAQELMHHMHWRWRSRTGPGKNGASWQWRTGRTTQLVLRNTRVLRSRLLNAADGLWHWERESNEVNVQ